MQRPASSPARITARPAVLVRWFLLVCVALSLWLAVPPTFEYLETREQAAQTAAKLERLDAEKRRLQRQSDELARGTGLEEQARRQGLIDPDERSYVVEGLPTR